MSALVLAAVAVQPEQQDWWSEHATLIVGVVGIIFSGFVGPSVTALFTSSREATKDRRAVVAARRDDLRAVSDEAAKVLAGAVANLRPLLNAQLSGEPPPREPADFLSSLFAFGQRLRLRLPEGHPVIERYDQARTHLIDLSTATSSQKEFDAAVEAFDKAREEFLRACQVAITAPIEPDKEI